MYLLLLAKKKCVIDDSTFQLHYRWTSGILVLFAALIGIKQKFGDPIHCFTNGVPSPFLDNYCSYIHGKWTVFEFNHTGVDLVLHEVPYPDDEGIDDQTNHWHRSDWFPILLLLSAVCFCVPRCCWERWEGGRMENICGDMFLYKDPVKDKERVTMLLDCVTKKSTKSYFTKYVFCEGLNTFNLVLQMLLMDCFLNGDLLSHLHHQTGDFMNVMQRVFPTWIICSTVEHGDQNLDGLCNLPINIINQNIFCLLLVWFIYLSVRTTVATVERNLSMISQGARR